MTSARPYATLLAKGEDRKQRILAVAQRLVTRNGWRNTTLAQIAKEAGVSAAGLLHHFESKEQLLHAVRRRPRRRRRRPRRPLRGPARADRPRRRSCGPCAGTGRNVLGAARREPDARRPAARPPAGAAAGRDPDRHRPDQRGQQSGRYRNDFDAALKAVQIVSLVNGMEISWLLDPSVPLQEALQEYARSLAREFAPGAHIVRYRLDVVAPSVAEAVRAAGGWMFDRVMAGWDVAGACQRWPRRSCAADPRRRWRGPRIRPRDRSGRAAPARAGRRGGPLRLRCAHP